MQLQHTKLMSKNRYKRHSRGGRFQQQGEGSRAAVDNIRQQRQIEIDALKLQAQQQKEQSSLQISGLRNQANKKVENNNILQKLENQIYQTKRNAIDVKGRRDVESILGEAKELGKEAEFWENFATKHSENYGKLAGNLYNFAQYQAAIKAYEGQSEAEKAGLENAYEASYQVVYNEAGEAIYQIEDLKERKDLIKRVSGFANNAHYHNMIAKDFIASGKARQSLLRGMKTRDGKALYNKNTAAQITLNSGYNFLYSNGVPLNSKAGRKVLSYLKQMAAVETATLTNADNLKTSNTDIQEHLELIRTALQDYDDPATEARLVTDEKSGKSAWISGSPSGKELFEDSVELLYHVIEGSHIKGTDESILPPGHPARKSKTIKEKWAYVYNLIGEGVDFKTTADGVNIMNIAVRNMKDGKITLNKNNEPAEYMFDKHPDMRNEFIKILDKNKNSSVTKRDQKIRKNQVSFHSTTINEIDKDSQSATPYMETLFNQDWRQSKLNWALDKKNNKSEEAKQILDLFGQTPELFKADSKDNRNMSLLISHIDQEYLTGDILGAQYSYIQLGENIPRLTNTHEALIAAKKVPDFTKTVQNYVKQEFYGKIQQGLTTKTPANKNNLDAMVDKGVGRFMAIWRSQSEIKDVHVRMEKTKELLRREIEDGLNNQKGWASATEMKSGSGDMIMGYKFAAFQNKDQVPKVIDTNDIVDMFKTDDSTVLTKEQIQAQDTEVSKAQVRTALTNNLKDLLTLNDAYKILGDLSTGSTSNGVAYLPKNLHNFIAVTKKSGYNLTTREIMNMAIDHIKTNGDNIWNEDDVLDSQFSDYSYEWPTSSEDLVKASCNKITYSEGDNIGIMSCQYLKNQGVDVNKLIIRTILEQMEAR